MSKVLIVSDSHGLSSELISIKEKHRLDVDFMLHCGDSELQADDPGMEGFLVARGNCDHEQEYQEEVFQVVAGKKMMMTHGHHYQVKSSLMSLHYRAKEQQADIVCFGHSHVLGAEMIEGILFINPGSIRLPRMRKEKTFCILEIKGDKVMLNVYDIHLGPLINLYHEFTFTS
jgi:uncharacterized protein